MDSDNKPKLKILIKYTLLMMLMVFMLEPVLVLVPMLVLLSLLLVLVLVAVTAVAGGGCGVASSDLFCFNKLNRLFKVQYAIIFWIYLPKNDDFFKYY